VHRRKKQPLEIVPLLPSDHLFLPLEELETRLESQLAGLPANLDDAHCLYYLCTTRCSGTKCPVFCACDLVVALGGTGDAL
jgi:hypothetical protein